MAFTITDAYHIVAVVSVVLGVLAAFFGCRVFRLFLALTGFTIFGTVGFVIVYYFITPNLIAGTVVGSVFAICGSVFMAHFSGFGAFLVGSLFGSFISIALISSISSNYMQEDDTRDITILGFAVMFGILSLHYRRFAIVAGTAFMGSFGIVSGADHFIHSGFNSILPNMANGTLSEISPNAMFFILIAAFVVITIIGALVQSRQMNKFDVTLASSMDYEGFNNYPLPAYTPNSPPSILSKIFTCHKKADEVPLLDVVSLEDY